MELEVPRGGLDGDFTSAPVLAGASRSRYYTLINPRVWGGDVVDCEYSLDGDFWPLVITEPTDRVNDGADGGACAAHVEVAQLNVEFWNQESWAGWRGWRSNGDGPDPDPTPVTFFASDKPPLTVFAVVGANGTDGAEVEFRVHSTYSYTMGQSVRAHSRASVQVLLDQPTELALAIRTWIRPLRVMMEIAGGGRTRYESLTVTNPAWFPPDPPAGEVPDDDPASTDHRIPAWSVDEHLQVNIRTGEAITADKHYIPSLFLFNLSDLRPKATAMQDIYRTVWTHPYAIDQYSLIRAGNAGTVLTCFVAAVQAVEALHRGALPQPPPLPDRTKWKRIAAAAMMDNNAPEAAVAGAMVGIQYAHRGTLEERLDELDAAGDGYVTRVWGSNQWPRILARARNIVAHGLPSPIDLSRNPRAVHGGLEIALLLLDLGWLRGAGFSPTEATELIDRCATTWRRKQVIDDTRQDLRTLGGGEH